MRRIARVLAGVAVGMLVVGCGSPAAHPTTVQPGTVRTAARTEPKYYNAGNLQANAWHNGVVPGTPLRRAPKEQWRKKFSRSAKVGQPVVGAGRIFFSLNGNQGTSVLYAFDVRTGRQQWKRTLPDPSNVAVYYGGGRVFTLRDGRIRAYRASTGAPLWNVNYSPGGPGAIDGLTVAYGHLYFVEGRVQDAVALRASDGAISWVTRLSDSAAGIPAVTRHSIYLSLSCQAAYRLRRSTGKIVWHAPDQGCNGGGVLTVVRGGELWNQSDAADGVTGEVLSLARGKRLRSFPSRLPPVISGRIAVLIANYTSQLFAIDADTGRRLWKVPTNGAYYASVPLVSGRTVYIASQDAVEAYDLRTGRQVWRDAPDGSLTLMNHIVIGAGRLVVATYSGLIIYR